MYGLYRIQRDQSESQQNLKIQGQVDAAVKIITLL
jgi:hypothetical protein